MANPLPLRGPTIRPLIAARGSLSLAPFTNHLQIVPRMGKFGPFLAVIRF